MDRAPEVAAAALPRLLLNLPGRWWDFPLHDPVAGDAAIRRIIDDHVGRADRFATLRRQLAAQLGDALRTASDGGASSLSVAVELVPRVPLSATCSVHLPDLSVSPAVGTDARVVMDVFAESLERSGLGEGTAPHRFGAGSSQVLRTHRIRAVQPDGDDPLDVLVIDYWITVPGTKRLALVRFSSPFVDLQASLLRLFDAVLRAATWQPARAEARG
ncbi:hypothetical protein CLV46_0394 [Diaminobutyricimonas aerilata]|uniref:Uncharacterized protein n=1 Tax=Diaminobutyricimonas aerilata TaxID=1162967 RepID=A0A2M9CG91_9MICO|nr:hypothetical protein [Diaminobutyricimonas aerilata]PJJ70865.1 hypothetical protein CLV46_0394 [Diaminobutyricimonas aerilata]